MIPSGYLTNLQRFGFRPLPGDLISQYPVILIKEDDKVFYSFRPLRGDLISQCESEIYEEKRNYYVSVPFPGILFLNRLLLQLME